MSTGKIENKKHKAFTGKHFLPLNAIPEPFKLLLNAGPKERCDLSGFSACLLR